ncbi:MAG TPA: pilus assembly protein PilM [Propionicimonas sp.]|uniref:pilus assembly protein PilM n=1 Tax=Propionicimonas sp. TaxID=1955623 RepID=UPI002F40056C
MSRSVIGVEVAEESIRAVEVTKGRHPVLTAAGEVLLPPGAARDSEVLDVDAVALALNQLWAQAGFRGRKAVLSVASRRLLVREYSAPNLPAKQLRAALPFEVEDLLPVPADRAVLDFYPLAIENQLAKGLLVAGAADGIEGLIAALRKARLWVQGVDFLPFGLARAVGRALPIGAGSVAVAAVGEHTTSFTVVVDGIPRYARIVPVDALPGLHARMAAAGGFGVGGPVSTPERAWTPAGPAADLSLRDLVGRIGETLEFCRRSVDAPAPEQLLLTGSLALVPAVLAALRHGIDIEVRTLLPADVVPSSRGLADENLPASLVGALGVTLGVTK